MLMNGGWQTWLQVYLVYGVINFFLGFGAVLTTDFDEHLNTNARNWAGCLHSLLVAEDYQHWSNVERIIPAMGETIKLPIVWAYPASIAGESWVQSYLEKMQKQFGTVLPILISEQGWQEKEQLVLSGYERYLLVGFEVSPNSEGVLENKVLVSAPSMLWSGLLTEILGKIPAKLTGFTLKPTNYLNQPGIEIGWSGVGEVIPIIEICLTAFKNISINRTVAL